MMAPLPRDLVEKLVKICRLFGSPFDGERATAAALANRMGRDAGLDWSEVWSQVLRPVPETRRPAPSPTDWAGMATAALDAAPALSEREIDFLTDMATLCRRGVRPTVKQQDWLRSLYDRAMGRRIVRRKAIDFGAINRAAMATLPAILERWVPGGRMQGREYTARNPTRMDRRPGSFRINVQTGRWADFATGHAGGDVVSLAAYLSGLPQVEAARKLGAMLGVEAERR